MFYFHEPASLRIKRMPTLAEFRAWVAAQPPAATYDYFDIGNNYPENDNLTPGCALTQFGRAYLARPDVTAGGYTFGWSLAAEYHIADLNRYKLQRLIRGESDNGIETFGDLLRRIDALGR